MKHWRIAAAAFVLYAIGQGVGVQSHALWYLLLAQDGGWSRATLAGGTTLFHLCAALAGVLCGRWLDRHRRGAVLLAGTLYLALGSVGLGYASQLVQVYGNFALLGLGFACLGPVFVGKLLAAHVPAHDRTAAMTLATSGTQVGLLLAPATMALALHGGRVVFGLVLAGLTLVVLLPLVSVLTRTQTRAPAPAPAGHGTDALTLTHARRQSAYWRLAGSVFLVVLAQAGYAAHSVLIYGQLTDLATGARLLALSAACGVGTRLWLCLRPPAWTPPTLAAVVYGLEAVGLGLLAWGVALPGAMLFGACATLTLMLEPLLAAHLCGTHAYGTLYGPIYAGSRVAAALGALVYGGVYTVWGSYTPGLWLMAGGLLVASGLIRAAMPLAAPLAVTTGKGRGR
jgi:Major Facilitator Superfamily